MRTQTLPKQIPNRHLLSGIWFVILFALSAFHISNLGTIRELGISPLIIGIVLGMFYGNTLRPVLPVTWEPGILFSAKRLLRIAVVLYGFRVTVQDLLLVGAPGILVSVTMVVTTFSAGSWIGMRFFGLNRQTAMLTAVGSAVCGAAAVLATEPVVDARPHETSIAVGTVVMFGTLVMFAYPVLYRMGVLGFDARTYGIFVGGTIHEVANAVAAGGAVSEAAGNTAVIVKMIRVMMIAPLLIVLSVLGRRTHGNRASMASFPWFALAFVGCVGIHSLGIVPEAIVRMINLLGTFLMTMAMCALGIETSFEKIRNVGAAPFYLAGLLCVWVTLGGYGVTRLVVGLFG